MTKSKAIKHVNLITSREIEIMFFENAFKLDKKEYYKVLVDGKEENFKFLSYFDNIATLRTEREIEPDKSNIQVKICDGTTEKTYDAINVPYYTKEDIGTKSKIRVRASDSVSLDVVKQAAEGINKMVGRSEFMTLEAAKRGLCISIVGEGESVYMVPEYRELYDKADANVRVTIPGSVEKPVIVTTASDVMRERQSDEYELIYQFAKLFLHIGVEVGAKNTPLGPVDEADLYDIYKRLEKSYDSAKAKNLWSNGMEESIEEYFAKGTMIFFEVTPESIDGSWNDCIGPVNTRLELKEYDRQLYDVLIKIYGEYEYISPYREVELMPWFVGTQPNRFGIDGKPLAKAAVLSADLISSSQIEIKFNREVQGAEDASKYRITYIPNSGISEESIDFEVLPYAWNAVTLSLGKSEANKKEIANKILSGHIGSDISGCDLEKGQYINSISSQINGKLKVEIINDGIIDWSGNSVQCGLYDVKLNPYLGQIKRTDKVGVYIYADKEVKKDSIDMASIYIDEILSNKTYGQGIADGLNKENAGLAIIAYGNHAYMQPDLRGEYHQYYLYVEGFGGDIAQTTESNIHRNKKVTRYDNEFILGHEFGHTIHLTGIKTAYPELYKEINDIYEDVVHGKQKLWPNSYAGSNVEEYFATLSNIWHSTMRESTDGTWNGTWGPVSDREELFRYDRKGYELMKKIYYGGSQTDDEIIKNEKLFLNTPWESFTSPNIYDVDCIPYEKKL